MNTMNEFMKSNAITILVLIGGMAIAWGALNARVMSVEAQEKALEANVAQYPSKDYFSLKFSDIDTKLSSLELQLNQVAKQTK